MILSSSRFRWWVEVVQSTPTPHSCHIFGFLHYLSDTKILAIKRRLLTSQLADFIVKLRLKMGDWEGSGGWVVLDPSPIKISHPYYGLDFTLFE